MRCDYHKFLRKHTVPPTLPVGRDVWRRAPIHQIGSLAFAWQICPLRAALAEANVPTLLMVYMHLTHSWGRVTT